MRFKNIVYSTVVISPTRCLRITQLTFENSSIGNQFDQFSAMVPFSRAPQLYIHMYWAPFDSNPCQKAL